jgi:hypothetical protein
MRKSSTLYFVVLNTFNMKITKKDVLKNFQTIPGVGKAISEDLWSLGLRKISDMKGKNPEALYEKLCKIQHSKIDRCMLYVLRCAVYFASNSRHEKEALKWWNWKD